MQQRQRQKRINEDKEPQLSVPQAEVFDTVGQPLPTSCAAGANLRELMERMGHSTTRAALIYQHRTSDRDKLIADAMGKLAKTELRQRKSPSGTQRARKGKRAS
jgi:hypothetical protein